MGPNKLFYILGSIQPVGVDPSAHAARIRSWRVYEGLNAGALRLSVYTGLILAGWMLSLSCINSADVTHVTQKEVSNGPLDVLIACLRKLHISGWMDRSQSAPTRC